MTNNEIKFPFYAKLFFVLASLSIIGFIVYVAHSIITPILISMLFAILLRPVVRFCRNRLRFPHVLAALTAVVLFGLCLLGILIFVSYGISDMASDWDKIKANLEIHFSNLQSWIEKKFNITSLEQQQYIKEAEQKSLSKGASIMSNTILSFTDFLMNFVLIPIYTFLFLLYRNLFLQFLLKVFKGHQERLQNILVEIKSAVLSYLLGLMIEMIIVSVLTSIGLSIIGVNYAILLGAITGLLNLVPYIGILVAAVLSIVTTLTTTADLSVIFGVVIVNVIVQFLDNNLLVPMVVSSKVRINALVSIVVIVIGGVLGGIAGMFLAIPMVAIIKVVFDRIEMLEPWGYLLGDDIPKTFRFNHLMLPRFDAGEEDIKPEQEEVKTEQKEGEEKSE